MAFDELEVESSEEPKKNQDEKYSPRRRRKRRRKSQRLEVHGEASLQEQPPPQQHLELQNCDEQKSFSFFLRPPYSNSSRSLSTHRHEIELLPQPLSQNSTRRNVDNCPSSWTWDNDNKPTTTQTKLNRRKQRWRKSTTASISALFQYLLLLTYSCSTFFITAVSCIRCYTDVEATKSMSVECGLTTGCVKIFIDSEELLMKMQARNWAASQNGGPSLESITLPERFEGNPILMRGCFVLAVPDRCYNAKNGVSYCWCSTKDLCNSAFSIFSQPPASRVTSLAALGVILVVAFLTRNSFRF